MFARGEEVILSELPPRKAIMLVISHNKVIYELKYSWKEIVLKFRKKRRERLRCGCTGYTAKLPEGGRPRSQDPGASDARLCVWGVI